MKSVIMSFGVLVALIVAPFKINAGNAIDTLSGTTGESRFSFHMSQGSPYYIQSNRESWSEIFLSYSLDAFNGFFPGLLPNALYLPIAELRIGEAYSLIIHVEQVEFPSFPDALWGGGAIPDSSTRELIESGVFSQTGTEIGRAMVRDNPESIFVSIMIPIDPKMPKGRILQFRITGSTTIKDPSIYTGGYGSWFFLKTYQPYVWYEKNPVPTSKNQKSWGQVKSENLK